VAIFDVGAANTVISVKPTGLNGAWLGPEKLAVVLLERTVAACAAPAAQTNAVVAAMTIVFKRTHAPQNH